MFRSNLTYIVIIAAIGGLLLEYNTSVIAGALLSIKEEIVLSTGQQSLIVSSALFAGWLANLFVSSSFLHMIEKISLPGTFLFYGTITLIGIFFVYRFIPETKGKTLEEVEASNDKSSN